VEEGESAQTEGREEGKRRKGVVQTEGEGKPGGREEVHVFWQEKNSSYGEKRGCKNRATVFRWPKKYRSVFRK
jgi:hypothetical protein